MESMKVKYSHDKKIKESDQTFTNDNGDAITLIEGKQESFDHCCDDLLFGILIKNKPKSLIIPRRSLIALEVQIEY